MFLKKIKLTNFRNFPNFDLNLAKLNIIAGPNGRGKTNILEAISLLSTTKSFRKAKNTDLVLWGKDFSRIVAEIEAREKKLKIEFILDLRPERIQPKTIKIDGRKIKLFYVLGKLKTVLFSPESLEIVMGAPQARRRFLDFLISQQDSKYAKFSLFYARILRNRNLVLFRINKGQAKKTELEFWTQELAEYGSYIIQRRGQLIEYFNQILSQKYQEIAGGKQNLFIEYNNKLFVQNLNQIKEKFIQNLNTALEKEIIFQKTIVGPHRDNLIFKIDAQNMIGFGSRGEVRTATLALKMAEVEYLIRKNSGDAPLLLLDDVFSELDPKRKEYLAGILDQVQTIITSCDLRTINQNLKEKAKITEL